MAENKEEHDNPVSPAVEAKPVSAIEPADKHMNGKEWMGGFNAIGEATNQILRNPLPLILYALANAAVSAYTYFKTEALMRDVSAVESAPDTAFLQGSLTEIYALTTLFGLLFLLAVPTYSLAVADRRIISLGEFMRFNAGKYISVLLVSILTAIVIGVSFLLLIIPAIFTIAFFALSIFSAADKGKGPIAAMKHSYGLSKHNKGKVWGVIGASFVVCLLMIIPYGILGAIPVVGRPLAAALAAAFSIVCYGALAILYRWLQHAVPDEPQAGTTPASPANVQ